MDEHIGRRERERLGVACTEVAACSNVNAGMKLVTKSAVVVDFVT